ncbi:MAG TPA: protein kinase [Actinomycetota bacterium]|nr:protein kinase [Actinomycetota bacterium]
MNDAQLLDGRYRLGEVIGSGGMAEVRRATDEKLGRAVAVKLLSGPAARDKSMRKRIEREARALASLSHPNIVGVYDYGEAAGPSEQVQPYLVMELIEGPDLHRHVQAKGPLPVGDAVAMLHGILSAVDAAHRAGIVHGDLKPANIVLAADAPKVGDFGVARILAEETGLTTAAATPKFAAPEVLRGERPSAKSDLYSAACVAFEMLTGRPPYEGSNGWEVAAKHMEEPVPSARDLRPEVPAEIDELIRRNMQKDPGRRSPTAKDFAEGLTESPGAPATVQVRPDPEAVRAVVEPTEALPDRPDLAGAVKYGALAGFWSRRRRYVMALGFTGLFVALLAIFASAIRTGADPDVAVPDVRGMTSAAAATQLRKTGFSPDVVYRPIVTGTEGIVIETIPRAGAMVRKGSEVHVVAGALVSTPEPPQRDDEKRGDGEKRGKDNRGRGNDRDDD